MKLLCYAFACYCQAKYLVEMGFPYWFDMDENEKMEEHKKEFEVSSNEEDLLDAYYRPVEARENGVDYLSASQIQKSIAMELMTADSSIIEMG